MYERMSWKDEILMKERAKIQRDKNFARKQVAYAVKTGRLKKESCKCGSTKVEGHHGDYSRPLDVIWACRKCHAELDKMRRELESFEHLSPPMSPEEIKAM